jgi:hypothetical protein
MQRHTVFMHNGHLKQLRAIADDRGLKTAQLIRIAIVEFLRRETRKQAAQVVIPGRKSRRAVLLG